MNLEANPAYKTGFNEGNRQLGVWGDQDKADALQKWAKLNRGVMGYPPETLNPLGEFHYGIPDPSTDVGLNRKRELQAAWRLGILDRANKFDPAWRSRTYANLWHMTPSEAEQISSVLGKRVTPSMPEAEPIPWAQGERTQLPAQEPPTSLQEIGGGLGAQAATGFFTWLADQASRGAARGLGVNPDPPAYGKDWRGIYPQWMQRDPLEIDRGAGWAKPEHRLASMAMGPVEKPFTYDDMMSAIRAITAASRPRPAWDRATLPISTRIVKMTRQDVEGMR
jgi:hypothetical protein